jgi:hypothetical protein
MVTIQDNGLQVGHKTTQEMHIALISTRDQPILLSACDENVEFAERDIDKTDAHTSAYAELAALITSTGALTYVIVVKDVHTCPTIALKTGVNFAIDETTVPPCARESAIATLGAFITSMPVPTCVVAVKHRHIQL